MRVVLQRVTEASVEISETIVAKIGCGLVILLGVEPEDTVDDIKWLSAKISKLRIFSDAEGLMNRSILDCKDEVILVSQFTLFASTKKGNRPGFTRSAKPDVAIPLYVSLIKQLEVDLGKPIQTG